MKVLEERHLLAKIAVYNQPLLDYRQQFLLTPLQNLTDNESSTPFYDLMLLCAVVAAQAGSRPLARR